MRKIKTGQVIAATIKQIDRGTIDRFVASDYAIFMRSAKGTPAFWKQCLYDGFVMV